MFTQVSSGQRVQHSVQNTEFTIQNTTCSAKYRSDLGPSGPSFLSSVQLLSHVQLFATPWIAAHRASLSIESVMPSNHLVLCRPLFLLPSIFPGIRVFSSESVLPVRWPKYWSFSFCISPSNEHWKNSFPRTIITKYYKLGGVNDRNLFSHISRD